MPPGFSSTEQKSASLPQEPEVPVPLPRLDVVYISDNALMAQTLAACLRGSFDGQFHACSHASIGELPLPKRGRWICVLDCAAKGIDRFELLARLRAHPTNAGTILITHATSATMLYCVSILRVEGVVDARTGNLLMLHSALRQLAEGGKHVPVETWLAAREFAQHPQAFHKILSQQQVRLMPFFSAGMTDEEIAARTWRSPLTIRRHRQDAMAALALHTSAALYRWAAEAGF